MAEAIAVSDVFLRFVVPDGARAGPSDITIDTGAGTATAPTQLEILDLDAAVLEAITPASASGTEFTISGERLDQVSSLNFNPFFEPVILEQTDTSYRLFHALWCAGPTGPLVTEVEPISPHFPP